VKHLPLPTRLALGFLLVGVLPLIGLAWFYLNSFERALTQTVLQNVSSIADKKADQINDLIGERLNDAQTLGQLSLVRQSLVRLAQDFQRGGLAATLISDRHYRHELTALLEFTPYHDLLLIDAKGNVVFSLQREADLGSNLVSGPYRTTGLALAFRQAMASLHTDLTFFQPYAPSANQVAAFIVAPILEGGRPLGALALQFNLSALTPVVADRTGLGVSGETVLAQRVDDQVLYTIALDRVADAAYQHRVPLAKTALPMQKALGGGHDRGVTQDYVGIDIAAAWRYLPALHWGMVVKIDAAEVFAPAQQARQATLLALIVFLFFSGMIGLLLSRRFLRSEGIIAAQEARYRAMFRSINDGVALYRAVDRGEDFIFLDFNTAAERITRISRDEVLGQRVSIIFPGLKDSGIFVAFQRVAASGVKESVAMTQYQDQSLSLWVENDIMRLPGGELLSVFKDITPRKQAEESLHLYANIFEHSGEAIMVTNRDNAILAVNPAFTQLTGYTLDDVQGRSPTVLSSGRTPPETYQILWASLHENGFWQGELWDRRKNGEIYPKWAAISTICDEAGKITHHIASFIDISERKAAKERISHLAHHDALTGLFNRYNLENRLSQAKLLARREDEKLAVMFIDMDRFKAVNDTLGHPVGDLLLIEVAQRLRACVRESDIVARLGGDEFVVVLTGLLIATDAAPVAEKILQALGQPYRIDQHALHTTPSIGISLFPDDGIDAATLMKNADTAMYHAKEQGRNNVQYFTAALNAAAGERLELEHELRAALVEKQFEVHYQPQICANEGSLCGVEALVRWRHPQRGMIPPLKFIPIAEETGLIEALGAWVLDESCRQLAVWRAEGISGVRMAVNLSAHQLRSPALIDLVRNTLHTHQLGEGELELEITESVAMSDPEHAIQQLQALRALGVLLAIDDFGTGYSSLAYLKRLPIQVLKLDREFVRDIETDANDAAISAATLALAHSLGLKVVAEGVETAAQRDFLVAHGCDLLQGFGIAKPMPGSELPAWAKNWNPHAAWAI
jgi:diguanylate cyclase (GGDEF)-like protein/PAS domain S-box-containing protein